MKLAHLWCCLTLAAAPLAADELIDWRDLARQEDQPRIDAALETARSALQGLSDQAYGLDERPMLLALLDADTRPVNADTLQGNWRCRSLQVDTQLGVFTYRYFRCRIGRDAWSRPIFEKLTGSQRRNGYLYPDQQGGWVFLGARTVNDDPQRQYSAILEDADESDLEHDSVGVLQQLKDGRLRMIFDASERGVELYELVR